jgi:hypothetical protein
MGDDRIDIGHLVTQHVVCWALAVGDASPTAALAIWTEYSADGRAVLRHVYAYPDQLAPCSPPPVTFHALGAMVKDRSLLRHTEVSFLPPAWLC